MEVGVLRPITLRLELRRSELLQSAESERVYRLDPESGDLRFGDGERGRTAPTRREPRTGYRVAGEEALQVIDVPLPRFEQLELDTEHDEDPD